MSIYIYNVAETRELYAIRLIGEVTFCICDIGSSESAGAPSLWKYFCNHLSDPFELFMGLSLQDKKL